jgi:dTMP kinase
MDVTHSGDPVASFRTFQSRVLENYDKLTQEFGLRLIDASGESPAQQKIVRKMVQEILRDYDRNRARMNHGAGVESR